MQSFHTLIEVEALVALIAADAVTLVDCRSDLFKPDWGREAFLDQHIPGARFADLNLELSDLGRTATEGRHPLPTPEQLARVLSRLGVEHGRQVVIYDQQQGMYAARLWWLLRAVGHREVAVLDGGLAAWIARELPLGSGAVADAAVPVPVREYNQQPLAAIDRLLDEVSAGQVLLVDARAPARFAGREEPIDPVAGHVPGARNRPYVENLRADGRFKPSAQLREEWRQLLGTHEPGQVVHMCGSGVTACHNLLALAHAGLGSSILFAQSWSGWITDPKRPVASGPD